MVQIFVEALCLPNSFHVNRDQSGKGYLGMTYMPFTIEGNFAFASGINEMLFQSQTGIIHFFPAIPEDWNDISFENIRTVGAFLISAKKEFGELVSVTIVSEIRREVQNEKPIFG